MTYLVERLAELRRHLDHLHHLQGRVAGSEALETDLSLPSDVLFSLLTVCQMVIDISGGLAARRSDRFEDYAGAGQPGGRRGCAENCVVPDVTMPGMAGLELQVLSRVLSGKQSKQIAADGGPAEKTVEIHRARNSSLVPRFPAIGRDRMAVGRVEPVFPYQFH